MSIFRLHVEALIVSSKARIVTNDTLADDGRTVPAALHLPEGKYFFGFTYKPFDESKVVKKEDPDAVSTYWVSALKPANISAQADNNIQWIWQHFVEPSTESFVFFHPRATSYSCIRPSREARPMGKPRVRRDLILEEACQG